MSDFPDFEFETNMSDFPDFEFETNISDAETIGNEITTKQINKLTALAIETSDIVPPLIFPGPREQIARYIDGHCDAWESIRVDKTGAIDAVYDIVGTCNLREIHDELAARVRTTTLMDEAIRYAFVSVYIASKVCTDSRAPYPTSLVKALRIYSKMRRAFKHYQLNYWRFQGRDHYLRETQRPRGIRVFITVFWSSVSRIIELVKEIGRKGYVYTGFRS